MPRPNAAAAPLSEYLDRIGYRARFASSRGQALPMLRGGLQTDAVVYGATMPMMGGRAFVRQLRSEGSGTPVLLMTGMRPSRGGRRRCAPTR